MIRPYYPGDLYLVLPHIRQAELDEAKALGEDPLRSLQQAIYAGDTVTLELNNEVCGLAGIVPCGSVSTPWAVFTDAIEKAPLSFMRDCKRWINRYDAPMVNVVDERNKQVQKWLKALGFKLGEPFEFGVNKEPFLPYWKGAVSWVGYQT